MSPLYYFFYTVSIWVFGAFLLKKLNENERSSILYNINYILAFVRLCVSSVYGFYCVEKIVKRALLCRKNSSIV